MTIKSPFHSATLFFLIGLICFIGNSMVSASDQLAFKELDRSSMERFTLYAMMASNSYHDDNRVYFPLDVIGWKQVDRKGKPTTKPTYSSFISGLAYDIFENEFTDDAVFTVRGTDSKLDWAMANLMIGISPPYKSAKKKFKKYRGKNPDKTIAVTGHSLGGGISLSISCWEQAPAIVFDSSPRVFDGSGDKCKKAKRESIYQKGEILEKVRAVWTKDNEVIDKEDIYVIDCDFDGVSNHRMDALAHCLLKMGAETNQGLRNVLEAMPADR